MRFSWSICTFFWRKSCETFSVVLVGLWCGYLEVLLGGGCKSEEYVGQVTGWGGSCGGGGGHPKATRWPTPPPFHPPAWALCHHQLAQNNPSFSAHGEKLSINIDDTNFAGSLQLWNETTNPIFIPISWVSEMVQCISRERPRCGKLALRRWLPHCLCIHDRPPIVKMRCLRKIVGQQQIPAPPCELPKPPSHQNVQHRLRSDHNLNLF